MSRQFSWLGSSPLCAFPEILSSDIMQSCSPHSGGTAPALPEPLMHQRLLPASLLSLATPAPPYAILRNVRLTYVIILCLKVIIKILSQEIPSNVAYRFRSASSNTSKTTRRREDDGCASSHSRTVWTARRAASALGKRNTPVDIQQKATLASCFSAARERHEV